MRNKYRGICADGRGKIVEPGGGFFEKRRGARGFDVRCEECVVRKRITMGWTVDHFPDGQRATAARLIAAAREKAHPGMAIPRPEGAA